MLEVVALIGVLAIVAGIVAAVFWTGPLGKPSFMDFPDHVQTAAFRWIDMPTFWPSYLARGNIQQIADRREHINRKRKKAKELTNPELRSCVMLYLDHYESKLPEEERELREQISRKELDEYKARTSAQSKKAQQLLDQETRS